MPDQNTQTVINVGDELTIETVRALPIGSIISDTDGDTFALVAEGRWKRKSSMYPDGHEGTWVQSAIETLLSPDSGYTPVTLTSLPSGATSIGRRDLYQQARIALRDRTGTDPLVDDCHAVARIMEDRGLTPAAAVTTWQLATAKITTLPDHVQPAARFGDPTVEIVPTPQDDKIDERPSPLLAARSVGVSGLLDADFAVVVFVKDNDVSGLARLRAHAALDALLDQHGVTR